MFLIFDTETTGLPRDWNAPLTNGDNWPRCIQIAWQLHDEDGNCISHEDYLIRPDGFTIPYDAEKIHGISTTLAQIKGIPIVEVLKRFQHALHQCEFIGGHNVKFDLNIVGAEFFDRVIKTHWKISPLLIPVQNKLHHFVCCQVVEVGNSNYLH